ncbi:MAG TPA: alpha-amylase family glycosyl hydrolase [Pseudonocardiaceae bacterium]|nr:alpha-amylase family glycosyl hydrolase [Pseudonocardiaceae bacterium]
MTGWPDQPVICEINTAVWLESLSRSRGRRLTLADVPATEWDEVAPIGVDAVWLMGVWERSPAGLALASTNPDLWASFLETLPDLRTEDVIGSPYCVRRYVVDPVFGGPDGLARARTALAARGVRLVLDYVPNHVAPDHPWVTRHPDYLVRGDVHDLKANPAGWLAVGGHVVARGRDPYFPPWPEVVQLDAFSPDLRAATVARLTDIADQCDGIRCDMAMLMTNQVFAKTWGSHAGPAPNEEFWPTVIAGLRTQHPETVLIAEAYWDMEWTLQQQGFAFCYDKRLYDRITVADAPAVHDHLRADLTYQRGLVRFLENHDEPRIASLLPEDAERAAAVAIATLPGATLWHEGQLEGRRVRPSVFLSRRPDESPNDELGDWHRGVLALIADHQVRQGTWQLLEPRAGRATRPIRDLLAWSWTPNQDGPGHLVVINLSGQPAQARIPLPWPALPGHDWHLTDLLAQTGYDRNGDELAGPGLYVSLDAWQYHLLSASES